MVEESSMSLFWQIAIVTGIAGVCGTGLGGAVGAIFKKDSSKVVSLLLSFAGGVMLAVVSFDLIPGAFGQDGAEYPGTLLLVVLGVLLGYAIVNGLNVIIDKKTNHQVKHINDKHPKTADNLDELIHADHFNQHKKKNEQTELFLAGIIMALAIALHNMPEGMVIGASYAETNGSILQGGGFILAVVIGLHNIPEGMAVSVPLIAGGTNKWRAIGVTALSGAPTVLGAMLGYSIGMVGEIALTLSLSFAGGAMLYVVFGELLPEAILMWKSKLPAFFTLIGTLVGLILVYV